MIRNVYRRWTSFPARSLARWALYVGLGATVLLLTPRGVAAESGDQSGMIYLSGSFVLGAGSVTFLAADIVYGAQARLVPSGWAVPQLVVGGLELGYGFLGLAMWLGVDETSPPSGSEFFLPIAVSALALGTWHVAHAIWSLVAGDAPTGDVAVVGVPVDGGAALQLTGRF